ncbi:hypothetical protein E2320_001042 [Naja naja]|nr:hypothetical protein E2320_001042 [Naja naja]
MGLTPPHEGPKPRPSALRLTHLYILVYLSGRGGEKPRSVWKASGCRAIPGSSKAERPPRGFLEVRVGGSLPKAGLEVLELC